MHWYDCTDIRIEDDSGGLIYEGPKFLRCMYSECGSIVTQGKLEESDEGVCYCGGRKFRPALLLKEDERRDLMTGKHPLNEWERVVVGDDSI